LPEDIAAMVAYLASNDGSWINGQIISVDGGTVLR
jgi:NAD(P)-dependent dehydrogenase (short-subunit alcohol dehydrogenase family)